MLPLLLIREVVVDTVSVSSLEELFLVVLFSRSSLVALDDDEKLIFAGEETQMSRRGGLLFVTYGGP